MFQHAPFIMLRLPPLSKIRDVNTTTPDVEGGSQVFEVAAGGKLRCFSQFIFAHDAFVQLIAIPNSVFKLAIILRQSLEDDVRASRGVLVKCRSEKNNFSDLKFVCHDTLPLNKPSTVIVHQSGQRDKGLDWCVEKQPVGGESGASPFTRTRTCHCEFNDRFGLFEEGCRTGLIVSFRIDDSSRKAGSSIGESAKQDSPAITTV